jgi:hypothetical protein
MKNINKKKREGALKTKKNNIFLLKYIYVNLNERKTNEK